MAHYFARPRSPRDGQDKLGTEGVLSGEFQSLEMFTEFILTKFSQDETLYSVYHYDRCQDSTLLGIWQGGRGWLR